MSIQRTTDVSMRVPVIALDYDSRHLALKKELLVDYKNKKIFITSPENSGVFYDLTDTIINQFKSSGLDINDFIVDIDGIGRVNLSEVIKQLLQDNIKIIKSEDLRFSTPTISFDQMSIVNYNRTIGINGFKGAPNDCYPVKSDGVIKWVPRTDTGLLERVKHLESIAPPDADEMLKLRTTVEGLKITADYYSDLPSLISSVKTNSSDIENIKTSITKLSLIDDMQEKINSNSSKLSSQDARISSLEDLDVGGKISNVTLRVTALENTKTSEDVITGMKAGIDTLNNQIPAINLALKNATAKGDANEQEIQNNRTANDKRFKTIQESIDSIVSDNKNISKTIETINALNVPEFKTSIEGRVSTLEGKKDLSNNVENLESNYSRMSSSIFTMRQQIEGILKQENIEPRVVALEAYNKNSKNIQFRPRVSADGGVSAGENKLLCGNFYSFTTNFDECHFLIARPTTDDKVQVLDLDIDFMNSGNLDHTKTAYFKIEQSDITISCPIHLVDSISRVHLHLTSYDGGLTFYFSYSFAAKGVAE